MKTLAEISLVPLRQRQEQRAASQTIVGVNRRYWTTKTTTPQYKRDYWGEKGAQNG